MTVPTLPHQSFGLSLLSPQFIRYFGVIGLGLLCASFLYLVGANWFMLPDGVKLAIAPVLLAVFAGLSVFLRSQAGYSHVLADTFETMAGVMTGLSLAVIGQVYQTGADSAWLFVWWLVLLLPWCYRHNAGMFVLVSVVSHIAWSLGVRQWGQVDEVGVDLLVASVLAVGQFFWARRYHPSLMYVCLAGFAGLSIVSAVVSRAGSEGLAFLSIWFSPLVAILVGRRDDKALITSIGVGILGTALFLWFVLTVALYNFVALGLAAIIWFAVAAALVYHLFPKGKFHTIPLAIGGWFAGLFLSSAIVIDMVSGSMVVSVLVLMAGVALLKWQQKQAFLRHLGYALFMTGQLASYYWLGVRYDIGVSILVQMVLVAGLAFMRVHWTFLLVQCLGLYGLTCYWIRGDVLFYSVINQPYESVMMAVLQLLGAVPVLLLSARRLHGHFRLMAVLVLAVLVGWALQLHFFGATHGIESVNSAQALSLIHAQNVLFYVAWLPVLFVLWWQMWRDGLPLPILTGMAAVSLVLGYFGYANVFFVLMVLAYAIHRQDKLVQVLACAVTVFLLWQLYYSLAVVFLFKFVSILVSALAVIALAWLMKRHTVHTLPSMEGVA